MARLGNWSRAECGDLRGRDPGTLSINLDKNSPLELYFPNMCRAVEFRYRYSAVLYNTVQYRCTAVYKTSLFLLTQAEHGARGDPGLALLPG